MLEVESHRALLVDLYELTMAAAYYEQKVDCRATFELFVRQMPPERAYLVAGGIEEGLDYLTELRFREEDLRFLRSLPCLRAVRMQAGFRPTLIPIRTRFAPSRHMSGP